MDPESDEEAAGGKTEPESDEETTGGETEQESDEETTEGKTESESDEESTVSDDGSSPRLIPMWYQTKRPLDKALLNPAFPRK